MNLHALPREAREFTAIHSSDSAASLHLRRGAALAEGCGAGIISPSMDCIQPLLKASREVLLSRLPPNALQRQRSLRWSLKRE